MFIDCDTFVFSIKLVRRLAVGLYFATLRGVLLSMSHVYFTCRLGVD